MKLLKLKNLSYELVVTRFNADCTFDFTLKDDGPTTDAKLLVKQMDDFIDKFNEKLEKLEAKKIWRDIIQDVQWRYEGNRIIAEMDMSLSGFHFLKKFLVFVSGMNCFKRVEIC